MRRAVTRTGVDGVPMLDRGRPSDGGMWGYWFCAPCNQATGRWDEEFLRWQRTIFKLFPEDHLPKVGEIFGIQVNGADPGGFIRCLWAWMFALDKSFIDDDPTVATAVRQGQAGQPPPDLRLLIALSADLSIWLTSQRTVLGVDAGGTDDGWWRRGSGLWAPQPQPMEMPYVVVAAPPFNVVLADRSHDHGLPHFNASAWLEERAFCHRNVVASLPVVQVTDVGIPRPVTYERFVPRPRVA